MEDIKLNLDEWNNDIPVSEQTEANQKWFNKEVYSALSFFVPAGLKQSAAKKAGIKGKIHKEAPDGKIGASVFDNWARPKKWELFDNELTISVEFFYMSDGFSWNLNYITCKIEKDEKTI